MTSSVHKALIIQPLQLPHSKLQDDNHDRDHHPDSNSDDDKAVGGDETDGNDNEGEEDDEELQDLLASTGMMPTWFVSAIRYLYQPNATWIECIRSFVKLEEVLGFPSGKGVRGLMMEFFSDANTRL